jgi:shikimate kinase
VRRLNIPRPENVVLVGFMGSGKSSVGRLVARTLQGRFVDTDRLVVERAGREITEIFATEGESFFRGEETRALKSLLGSTRLVVATGGGIVTVAGNQPVLRELGLVVWLQASEEIIWHRVSRNTKRPLLHAENPRETIHALLTERSPMYEKAAELTIDTSTLTHAQVAEVICRHLKKETR